MKKKIEYYDFSLAGHFLSGLINDDVSGLDDTEENQLAAFVKNAFDQLHKDGFKYGHWSHDADGAPSFKTCDACGLLADCYDVKLIAYK